MMASSHERVWSGLVVVSLVHAGSILPVAMVSSHAHVGVLGVAQAMSQVAATVLAVFLGPALRSRVGVAVWGTSVLFTSALLTIGGTGPRLLGAAAIVLGLDFLALSAYVTLHERPSGRTPAHRRPHLPRPDIGLTIGSTQLVVLAAWLIHPRVVPELQIATAFVVLFAALIPRTDSAWASAALARFRRGQVAAARRAAARDLASDASLYAAVSVGLSVAARTLADPVVGSSLSGVGAAVAAGSWLIPARLLGRYSQVSLTPLRPSVFVAGTIGAIGAWLSTMIDSGGGSPWHLALVIVGWLTWWWAVPGRFSQGDDGCLHGRYIIGPAVRGALAALIGVSGILLVSPPASVWTLAAGVALGTTSLVLFAPEIRKLLQPTAGRGRAGTHALVLPAGDPSLLGGPRSAIEAWSSSPISSTVLTKPASRAAAYASELGLMVEPIVPPDPRLSGKATSRVRIAIRWLALEGAKLTRFETAEVELNHVGEILPSAVWYGVPLIVSVRDYPQRPPGTRMRKWMYRAPAAMYCINDGIRYWLQEEAGVHGVTTIPIPVMAAPPSFELADAAPQRTLVMVGEISPKKGQLSFVRDVLSSLDGWRTVLVGSPGHDQGYVAALDQAVSAVNASVVMAGQLEDWQRAFGGRFVLVLNSQSEGGPRVAVEALALGVPVVMADFPGAETFQRVPFVWIVESRDQWRSALERAHRANLDPRQRATLESFLSKYERREVGHRLAEFWWRSGPEGGASTSGCNASVAP